jgi:hypothetical protein
VKRNIQVLLGWFEARDAIAALRGFRVPEAGADVSVEAAEFQRRHRAVQERLPYADRSMTIELLPAHLVSQGEAVIEAMLPQATAEARSRFATVSVDLTRVISFQKAVTLEDDEARFGAIQAHNLDSLFELCLPSQRVEEDLTGTFDRDGKGVTITSMNPNLRLGPVQSVELPNSNGVKLLGFPLVFGSPYVHVVEYKGRYFLKDGYHRCYGLLRRGISRVPVVLQKGRSFSDVHGGGSSFIAPEHLLGEHPPMLTDFLDPAVSATVEQQAFRKTVRIRAEEFVINL